MCARILAGLIVIANSSALLTEGGPTKEKSAPTSAPTDDNSEGASGTQFSRIRIVAYRVTLPEDQIENLNSSALESAASSKNGLKARLAQLGDVRVAGIVDQQISLSGESRFQLGRSVPVVSGTQKFKDQTSTQVQYSDCGCIFEIRCHHRNQLENGATLSIKAEVSSIDESTIPLAPNQHAPIYFKSTNSCSAQFIFGKPEVFVTVDSGESSTKFTSLIYEITIWPIADGDE